MTNGLITGKIIADQIMDVENPWSEVFNPFQMELAAIPKKVTENINVVTHFVGD